MNQNIKNIVFDLGGVLLNLDFPKAIEAFEKAGIHNVYKRIKDYEEENLFQQLEKGIISADAFREAIRKETSQLLSNNEIDVLWNTMLLDIPHNKLELILKLRNKYKVYLLSNTNEIHWDFILKNRFNINGLLVHDYFDKIYLSHQMHLSKPDPRIFKEMMYDANMLPDETFFIDDTEENCQVAKALGIHTHHYHKEEDLKVLFD